MILVALGTQDKQFYRLVKIIDRAIEKGVIKEEVIVQLGSTKFESDRMKTYKYISGDEMSKYTDEADLVVCHGGVGIITNSIKKNKKVFSMPRLKEFKEHRNNHQTQIVDKFTELGYIKKIKTDKYKYDLFKSNRKFISNKIQKKIEFFYLKRT